MYSTDASNYRQLPIGVVRPASVDDVEVAAAGQYGLTFGPDPAPTITALLAS
jgi:hypothetical protein